MVRDNLLTGNAGWGLAVQGGLQGAICGNDLRGNGRGEASVGGLAPSAPCPA